MITGIVSTDGNGYHLTELSPVMLAAMTNSYWFIRGFCEGTNVVTDYKTWKMLSRIEEIPVNVSTFLNVAPKIVSAKFPLTHVTVLGNKLVEEQLDNLTRIVHVHYKEKLSSDMINTNRVFPFPDVKPNILGILPHFQLKEYILKEDSSEV
jgi:hypothetical protein